MPIERIESAATWWLQVYAAVSGRSLFCGLCLPGLYASRSSRW